MKIRKAARACLCLLLSVSIIFSSLPAYARKSASSKSQTAPGKSSGSGGASKSKLKATAENGDEKMPSQLTPATTPETSLFSGAAVYKIPIEVPPGRGGVAPSIALTYNSQQGNGWVGVGWDLDMGSIQRSAKRGVNYSGNDFVAVINGSKAELVYKGDNIYETKLEGIFSRYYHTPDNPASGWVVTTKEGMKYYYGTSSASRQSSSGNIFKWRLDKVEDTNGNFMKVYYTKDSGEVYLDRIEYTGNAAGLSPTNTVQFTLESRSDHPTSYATHFPVTTLYRLKTIEVYGNGQLAGKYVLGYGDPSPSSSRSLLGSVTQYASDGSHLPATTFEWTAGGNGLQADAHWGDMGTPIDSRHFLGTMDLNGDGKSDVVYQNINNHNIRALLGNDTGDASDSGWGSKEDPTFVDFNSDGLPDVITFPYYNLLTKDINLSTNKGTSFSTSELTLVSDIYVHIVKWGDVDGDGFPDMIWISPYTGEPAAVIVYPNIVDTAHPGKRTLGPGTYWGSYSLVDTLDADRFRVADVNGDGLADLVFEDPVRTSSGSYNVLLSTGSSFGPQMVWGTRSHYCETIDDTSYQMRLVDVNGDGLPDIVFVGSQSGNTRRTYVKLNTGTGFLSDDQWGVISCDSDTEFLFADVNGDGMADRVYECDGYVNLHVQLSSGSGFTDYTWGYLQWGQFGDYLPYSGRADDVDGDGLPDYTYQGAGQLGEVGTRVLKSTQPFPDLLHIVHNPIGGVSTISYKASSAYSNTYLPYVVQTVSSIAVDDGNSHATETGYTYANGYHSLKDREFRGFGYAKQTDQVGTVTETWFFQDDIKKGLMDTQTVKDSSGNLYGKTVNTYGVTPYTYGNSVVNFVSLSDQNQYVYDGTGTSRRMRTTFTYDDYGNVTNKHSYGYWDQSGDDRDDHSEYNYDTTNWILSFPSRTWTNDAGGDKAAETLFTYYSTNHARLKQKAVWNSRGNDLITTYTYDDYGNLASVRDPNRNQPTTFTYDSTYTYQETVTNPAGHQSTAITDTTFGKPILKTDPNGESARYEYDVFGRLTKYTTPVDFDAGSSNGTRSYTYDPIGTVNAQHVTTRFTTDTGTDGTIRKEVYYDGLGREIKSRARGPEGKFVVVDTVYNNAGRVWKKSLPYFEGIDSRHWFVFTYDPIGRVIATLNPDGSQTTVAYLRGTKTLVDANGHMKQEDYDGAGRLRQVREYTTGNDPYAVTQYKYHVLGSLNKVIDAAGNQWTIYYDSLARKYKMTDPDMGTWLYSYDQNGNLTDQQDANGTIIHFEYDAISRMTLKRYVSSDNFGIEFHYDETGASYPIGRLTSVVDRSGTASYAYDQNGRTVSTTKTVDSVAYTVDTSYDSMDRIKTVTYPDEAVATYSYDATVLAHVAGDDTVTFSGFNAMGQPGLAAYGNGAGTTYVYDPLNSRLASINTTGPEGALQDLEYGYDAVGNITSIQDGCHGGNTQSFGYDELNRLTNAQSSSYGTITFAYDQLGNMTYNSRIGTYTYGGTKPHAVTQAGDDKTYLYDNNGNMTQKDSTQHTIVWNEDNKPQTITDNSQDTRFVYDYQGQRVKKIDANGSTTTYIGNYYECTDGTCTRHTFAGSKRFASHTPGESYYYHTDHLGGLYTLTKGSDGTSAEFACYYPFGGTRVDSGSANLPYKFTGQELDPETKLYNFNARQYYADLGRFISPDSVVPSPGDPQTLNRYSYCRNNPQLFVDPTGHDFGLGLLIAVIVGAAMGAATSYVSRMDIGLGALTGAIEAGAFYAAGSAVEMLTPEALKGTVEAGAIKGAAHATAGAFSAGLNAGITGGNIGQSMLSGAISAGVGGFAGGMLPDNPIIQFASRPLIGGISGGVLSEIYGGSFGKGFSQGASTALWGMLFNDIWHFSVGGLIALPGIGHYSLEWGVSYDTDTGKLECFTSGGGSLKPGDTMGLLLSKEGGFALSVGPAWGMYPGSRDQFFGESYEIIYGAIWATRSLALCADKIGETFSVGPIVAAGYFYHYSNTVPGWRLQP